MLLHYLCAAGGLILISGSLFLLWKGRILINAETKEVIEFELPMGLKLKTHAPVFGFLALGCFLLIFPILKAPEGTQMVRLSGTVKYPERVSVFAVARLDETSSDVSLDVPFIKDLDYRVMYFARNCTTFLGEEVVHLGQEAQARSLKQIVNFELGSNAPGPLPQAGAVARESSDTVSRYK